MASRKPPAAIAPGLRRERLTDLAEDCVRLMVQGIGGFPKTNNGEMMRQMVRELRVMYDEIDTPTLAPRTGSGKAARVVDDYDDGEDDL